MGMSGAEKMRVYRARNKGRPPGLPTLKPAAVPGSLVFHLLPSGEPLALCGTEHTEPGEFHARGRWCLRCVGTVAVALGDVDGMVARLNAANA